MSTEDERRARRAQGPRTLAVPPPSAPEPTEPVPTPQAPVQNVARALDGMVDELLEAPGSPTTPAVNGPGGLCLVAVEDDGPLSRVNTLESAEVSDVDATVRHDAESNDEPHPAAEGDRPVVDDGKAAGEAMRQQRQTRARTRHGHGWLDVEAFTDHLRTTRLHRIGEGEGTVNVRVSAELVKALETYRREVAVSKRDVVEALLTELLGPPVPEGGRR